MTWFIVAGAAIGAAGAVYGANKASEASKELSNAQDLALDYQDRWIQQARADSAPWRESGTNALNAYNRAMGLPTVQPGDPNAYTLGGHALYGDGNVPLTREGLMQAYRDVLGREPDQAGVDFYMSAGQRGASAGNIKTGIANAVGGPLSKVANSVWGDKAPQGPVTFNEFLNYTLNSDEYKEKTASGQLDPWSEERRNSIFNPQPERQEFIGGSETNPDDRYGGFYESPGYQFRMDEGIKALDQSAAARGRLLSGAQNKAINRYAQGVAGDEFHNYTQRLAQIAGLGADFQKENTQLSLAQAQAGANSITNAADARASGYLAQGNAFSNIGSIFGDALTRYGERRNNLSTTQRPTGSVVNTSLIQGYGG